MRHRFIVPFGFALLIVIAPVIARANPAPGSNCTYTIGYWKNHASAWPVSSVMLGSVSYSKAQALQILGQSVGGNGLISLAQQLIAAKISIAQGADPSSLGTAIASADALIGSLVVPPIGNGFLDPATTTALTSQLEGFNSGRTGPGHCGTTAANSSTWGALKSIYR
jgi:hypothetical protein